ncbi:ArnT family glycosyltransferase [Ferruginibacter sp. SUN106]|uniref:ArnT family glycosyltransferase n=1 Tax=Ferruginibacter sp. SUN106 TaxID=2978348 RepID=UPI003D366F0C
MLLIVIATLVRCIIAGCIELGNDEVYYRMYAQYLQWNYFDHPPMVGWLVRFTTINLFFDHELFIRFGAIASAAITTWLLFLCGQKLTNAYAGYLAAAIYTATIYGSIIAGTFILPDSPQMVCWAAALYLLIDISKYTTVNRIKKRKVLLFGIVCGLGMLCKIHTSFLWLGFLLYLIFYNRQWLKEPVLYCSGIITLLFFYPVIQWNIDNHFVTYLYHSNRVNVSEGDFNINSFLTFAGGQVFYYNPIIFFFIVAAVIAAFKDELPVLSSQKKLLLFCSLPLIIMATVISLFKDVLPHWTGPAYSGLILLTACYFSKEKERNNFEKKLMPGPLLFANALLAVVITGGVLLVNFFPGTLGKRDAAIFGEGDFTLDMYGWNTIKKNVKKIVDTDIKNGVMKKDAVIISNKWFPLSHVDFYVAMPLEKDVVAIGDTNDIHQYAWINTKRKMMQQGDDAYCIVPSNYEIDVKAVYGKSFSVILPPQIIEQKRNGTLCRYIYVWRLKNFITK